MSVAGAAMFSSGDKAQKQRQRLWSHSVGCALWREVLLVSSKVLTDEAFLAGVFHDVGKLLFYDAIPIEYAELDSSFSGLQLVNEEERLIGTTHEIVGLASAESWELSQEMKTAIRWHHRPELAELCPAFAQVINVADRMAIHWGIGSDAPLECDPTDNLEAEMEAELGLTSEQLETLEQEARQAFDETMAVSTG